MAGSTKHRIPAAFVIGPIVARRANELIIVEGSVAMSSPEEQKLPLSSLTAMVIGSVGAGIFNLPGRFATATGPFGAPIAWRSRAPTCTCWRAFSRL